MRTSAILRYIGFIFLFNASFLFISSLISLFHNDAGTFPLIYSTIICLIFGIFPLVFVPAVYDLSDKEGYVIVVFSWILSCMIGMLPYLLYGSEFNLTNAWFESVSGYTTTGSSILDNVEALPKGILFWRSSTHWLGGIGIVIFALVIIPAIGNIKLTLYKSEMSSLATGNFQFRARTALRIVVYVYLGLTLAETLILWGLGMDLFDAVCHSFSTIATGGFSTKNLSIAYFNNVPIELVIQFFMILSGMHFGILFLAFTGKQLNIFRFSVVRYYLLGIIIAILLVAVNIHGSHYKGWDESFRYASFSVTALSTTTGFANCDSTMWPHFSILILVFMMLQCACAGSTAGGIKVDRMVIFYKAFQRQIKSLLHPNAIIPVKIDKIHIHNDLIEKVVVFIMAYLMIVFVTGLALTYMNIDAMTAFTASATTMGNIGWGFGGVGSLHNFAHIPDAGKWLLTLNMLLGRLEIFGFILLFLLKFWKE
jgi:trk system potassium uptake protein TrkH